jgi:hypothetical protein
MPASTCKHCSNCGVKLPRPAPTGGRPRTFCGEPCKRAAGYEITRINRRLEKLEQQLADERITQTHSDLNCYSDQYGRMPAQRVDALEQEIKLTRDRLLGLLED